MRSVGRQHPIAELQISLTFTGSSNFVSRKRTRLHERCLFRLSLFLRLLPLSILTKLPLPPDTIKDSDQQIDSQQSATSSDQHTSNSLTPARNFYPKHTHTTKLITMVFLKIMMLLAPLFMAVAAQNPCPYDKRSAPCPAAEEGSTYCEDNHIVMCHWYERTNPPWGVRCWDPITDCKYRGGCKWSYLYITDELD